LRVVEVRALLTEFVELVEQVGRKETWEKIVGLLVQIAVILHARTPHQTKSAWKLFFLFRIPIGKKISSGWRYTTVVENRGVYHTTKITHFRSTSP